MILSISMLHGYKIFCIIINYKIKIKHISLFIAIKQIKKPFFINNRSRIGFHICQSFQCFLFLPVRNIVSDNFNCVYLLQIFNQGRSKFLFLF